MNIEANIKKTFSEGNVRAIADVTIDGAFAIHGLKLIEGSKGMFVAMPYAQWQDKNGQMHNTDIAHPITAEARTALFHAVKNAYDQTLAQTQRNDYSYTFGMNHQQ